MNQSLHDNGKSEKSKRKPKRRRNRESWNLILLMFAFHSAQAAGGWVDAHGTPSLPYGLNRLRLH